MTREFVCIVFVAHRSVYYFVRKMGFVFGSFVLNNFGKNTVAMKLLYIADYQNFCLFSGSASTLYAVLVNC